jgi:hypothetical protein
VVQCERIDYNCLKGKTNEKGKRMGAFADRHFCGALSWTWNYI